MTTTYSDEQEPASLRPLTSERPWRFSWGAVLAGATISLGLWLLLHVLGLGAGLTALNPDDLGSLRGVGMTTGIWSLIVPLIAMFLGGFAAAKVAGPITRLGGAIHGAVLWSIATLASTVLLMSLVSSLVGGVARISGEAVSAAGDAPSSLLGQTGITPEDFLAPVNERLQATGKPAVSGEQLQAATRDVFRAAVREGQLNREMLTTSLAQNTALTQTDAREIAGTIEQRWNQQTSELGQQAERAGSAALQAAETTGKGLLGLFFAMLLGLIAAVAGTTLGVTRAQLAVAERASERAERLIRRHA